MNKSTNNARPFDRFSTSLALVCRFRLPWSYNYAPKAIAFYLPLCGSLVLGAFMLPALAFQLLTGRSDLAALAGLVGQYSLFNLFHFDGLLDTADAFLGHQSAERRRAILKDQAVGSYGVFIGFVVLTAKLLLYTRLLDRASQLINQTTSDNSNAIIIFLSGLCLFPIAGRSATALLPCFLASDRTDGLGALLKGTSPTQALGGSLLSLALAAIATSLMVTLGTVFGGSLAPGWSLTRLPLWAFGPWLWFFISTGASTLIIKTIYQRGIGAYTGDALGAAIELAELFQLLPLII